MIIFFLDEINLFGLEMHINGMSNFGFILTLEYNRSYEIFFFFSPFLFDFNENHLLKNEIIVFPYGQTSSLIYLF